MNAWMDEWMMMDTHTQSMDTWLFMCESLSPSVLFGPLTTHRLHSLTRSGELTHHSTSAHLLDPLRVCLYGAITLPHHILFAHTPLTRHRWVWHPLSDAVEGLSQVLDDGLKHATSGIE